MPGNEAAVLLHVVRRVHRIEDDRHVEEAEEDDAAEVEQVVQRHVVVQLRRRSPRPSRSRQAAERDQRLRNRQHRRCEDDRDDAGGVDAQRQVRRHAAHDLATDDTARVLHGDAALGPFHQDDERRSPGSSPPAASPPR